MALVEAMQAIETMSDDQLERHALAILHRELGPHGLLRFLSTYRPGSGDYTRERHQWLDGLSVEEALGDWNKTSAPSNGTVTA